MGNNIRRLYVEKKPGFDVEATGLLKDINEILGIKSLSGLRMLIRYDIERISDEAYETGKKTIFSEPPVDKLFEEEFSFDNEDKVFAVSYIPGQYDQRADSAAQCLQIITKAEMPPISVAKVFVLKGSLSDDEFKKIKNYCINPVDSREVSLSKPDTLQMGMMCPDDIKIIEGFTVKSDEEISKFNDSLGLAMSREDTLFCREYFKDEEKRDPTLTEIKVIDTYWSDHCRHTTFQTKINNISIEDGFLKPAIENALKSYADKRDFVYGEKGKDITLMDMAVMGMKYLKKTGELDNLDESDEINACSVRALVDVDGKDEEWLLMFKNETHNHPTEIEPFGGAATCLGGAIRDPLSGRSYVYQAMRVTGAADPRVPVSKTLQGKLPQIKIVKEAAKGYSSYGNQIGLATGQVVELYHEDYVAKRMEIGAVIGAAKSENVIRKTPEEGDVIVLLGGKTGRDGCGGATGSSKEHTLSSINECGAEVQKGNPPTERKIQRLFRNPNVSKLIKKCNDFGAGGVSVAIGELADGLIINLDLVPKKYEGLDGTELAISESQERMAVVVAKEDVDRFVEYSKEENLEAVAVAVVTDNRRLIMNWRGKTIVDISRDFLDTNGVKQTTDVFIELPKGKSYFSSFTALEQEESESFKKAWLTNLMSLNHCLEKGLSERFDSTIGAGTVLMPFGGKNQLTPPEAMVALVPVGNKETETATIMSYGFNPYLSKWSPFHGALYAVVEAVSKIVATGGNYEKIRLSLQEYFEKLGSDSKKWGKPFSALLGALYAQTSLKVPAIGGKDSMSGTFENLNVPPTLVSFAMGVSKVKNIVSPEFKKAGSQIYFIPAKYDKYEIPDFEYLKKVYKLVSELISEGVCISAKTVGDGGIALALSAMSAGNSIGINLSGCLDKKDYFKPYYGAFILELSNSKVIDFKGLDAVYIGDTLAEPYIIYDDINIPLDNIIDTWIKPLEKIFPTKTDYTQKGIAALKPMEFKALHSVLNIAKPRVLIPVFPGTNCEYDSKKAFELAGGEAETLVIRNLNVSELEYSLKEMAEKIKKSQIIMIPGGFSAGDEPDGSGKFIAAVFRNPYISEAVSYMLDKNDGLMLGICNGFQALIKLGLLPYGKIAKMSDDSPTLTYNTIGRHVSCMVNIKIVSNKSPWLMNSKPGDIYTVPVSHGEGRFIANDEVLAELIKNHQIATQYVDNNNEPTTLSPYNPNGSMFAIEGITSPDGKILGKMGHSERRGNLLYKNIPGNKYHRIFESGIEYFR
ncbi:MAG: phosphoribosylformylglycinamidine synthase [Lachnospiraceae bacterium]|nr:phosphoribosylformylglycinamidine synthase [Lachnospiraceae bacterium]